MTYCVGLRMKRGLVFMSDTRTNAGVDNISMFRKMFTWTTEGERVITLLTAETLTSLRANQCSSVADWGCVVSFFAVH